MKNKQLSARAKLTPKQVKEIRGSASKTQRELAKEFNVSQTAISMILRGVTYKGIKSKPPLIPKEPEVRYV